MVKIFRIFFVFIFFCASAFVANSATAGDISYEIKNDKISFFLSFTKGYSDFSVLESQPNVIFNFETSEDMGFKEQTFFDLPIKSFYLKSDSFRKKFIVVFDGALIKPSVTQDEKKVTITFSFPQGSLNFGAGSAGTAATPEFLQDKEQQATRPPVTTTGAYFRMIFGLGVVLCIILFVYWGLKSYSKKQVFTDIPGSGRLLGKVDLDMRKSLYFYEVGDSIYIIGATDSAISLIDKVTDEIEATKIRAGLRKKSEFKGYMSFFGRKNGLDEDMSTTNAIVEDKLNSLRKK